MPGDKNRYTDSFEYMFVFSKGKPKTFNPLMVPTLTAGKKQTWSARPHESKIWKKKPETRTTNSMKIAGNIWEYSTGKGGSSNDEIAFDHPAIFPEQLAADHIKSWSNEGDLVYDPFAGSGTTLKMAHLLNRNWVGSEISEKYTALAYNRMKPYLTQHKLEFDE